MTVLNSVELGKGPEAQGAMSELIRQSYDDAIANLPQARRITGGKQVA